MNRGYNHSLITIKGRQKFKNCQTYCQTIAEQIVKLCFFIALFDFSKCGDTKK